MRKEHLQTILGLLISAAAVALILWAVDLGAVQQALGRVSLTALSPLLILVLVSYGARAACWWTILPGKLPYTRVFLVMNAGYLINTVFPFRMGEIGRALLLKTDGLKFWKVVPTILLERIFDLALALALFFSALPFLFDFQARTTLVVFIAGLVPAGLGILYALKRYQEPVLHRVGGREQTNSSLRKWLQGKLKAFLSGLNVLEEPKRLLAAFLWMVVSWTLALVYQFFLMQAVLGEARPLWVTFSLGAVALGAAIPSSPGNLGVYEASLIGALSVFGIDRSLALTYAILSHGLNIGIALLFGTLALVQEGAALGSIWAYRTGLDKEGKL